MPNGWKSLLGVFRFVSLFVLTFLLLEPLLEYAKTKVERPIVVLLKDNSSSVLANRDSVEYASLYEAKMKEVSDNLSQEFEVVSYSFGKQLSENDLLNFAENGTNLSAVFSEVQQRYYNRNLGAIVLASDGIYNQGSNPIYSVKEFKNVPVNTVLLGDSSQQKDSWIENVFHNKIAYQGNTFPVEIAIQSSGVFQDKVRVTLQSGGALLSEKPLFVSSSKGIQKVRFEIEAAKEGLQKFTAKLEGVEGEVTLQNNQISFYVEVLKSKQKILLLANSPHPDVQAIKNGLISNDNYQMETKLASDIPNNLKEYSLIITHNLPSSQQKVLEVFNSVIPVFSIVGNQVDFGVFNQSEMGVQIKGAKTETEASLVANSSFNQFGLSIESISKLGGYSPIQVPFSNVYEVSNSSQVALFQRIGPAKTDYPLLLFSNKEERKRGVLVGEGFWRWRLQEFGQEGSSQSFDELFQQSVQLLVAKEDKSRFRVEGKPVYSEGDDITVQGEVYNKSYELINSQEVAFQLTDENKEKFDFLFSPSGESYALALGKLKSGNYSYTASTLLDGKKVNKSGEFSVEKVNVEFKNTRADFDLMYQLSASTNGKMVPLDKAGDLVEYIASNQSMVDVRYEEKEVEDLIELKLLFYLLLAFLGVEWFVRKRNGGY